MCCELVCKRYCIRESLQDLHVNNGDLFCISIVLRSCLVSLIPCFYAFFTVLQYYLSMLLLHLIPNTQLLTVSSTKGGLLYRDIVVVFKSLHNSISFASRVEVKNYYVINTVSCSRKNNKLFHYGRGKLCLKNR